MIGLNNKKENHAPYKSLKNTVKAMVCEENYLKWRQLHSISCLGAYELHKNVSTLFEVQGWKIKISSLPTSKVL